MARARRRCSDHARPHRLRLVAGGVAGQGGERVGGQEHPGVGRLDWHARRHARRPRRRGPGPRCARGQALQRLRRRLDPGVGPGDVGGAADAGGVRRGTGQYPQRLAVAGQQLVSGPWAHDRCKGEVRVWGLDALDLQETLPQLASPSVWALLAVEGLVWAGVGSDVVVGVRRRGGAAQRRLSAAGSAAAGRGHARRRWCGGSGGPGRSGGGGCGRSQEVGLGGGVAGGDAMGCWCRPSRGGYGADGDREAMGGRQPGAGLAPGRVCTPGWAGGGPGWGRGGRMGAGRSRGDAEHDHSGQKCGL